SLFEFIKKDEMGIRLIAKINDNGSAFTQEEIYGDFSKLYRKFKIKNKDLGDFFLRETKDSLPQLCDDFERTLREGQKKKPITEQAEGHIFIDSDNIRLAESVFESYASFANALGFTLIEEGAFEKGSWKKKGIRMVQDFFTKGEVRELYRKG